MTGPDREDAVEPFAARVRGGEARRDAEMAGRRIDGFAPDEGRQLWNGVAGHSAGSPLSSAGRAGTLWSAFAATIFR
jgi:hypothetical protein